MARHNGEVRWRLSSEAAKRYFERGRKLVGEVVERVLRGGLKHGARTVKLDDGTVIRVIADGSVPIAEIYAADEVVARVPLDSCSIFMESGQLSLGPSVASLSDSGVAPELTFNTRTAHNARFNGTVNVSRYGDSYAVQTGASAPADGESHACDEVRDADDNVIATVAAKKTAQFLVPASCFTGLMRRWVQALYGTSSAVYGTVPGYWIEYPFGGTVPTVTVPKLQVMTAQKDEDGNTEYGSINLDFRSYHVCGIVDPTRQLDFWFATIWPHASSGQKVEFRKANLTDCGKLLRGYLLQVGRGHPDYQKLSTFLMSQLMPENDVAVERAIPEEYLPAVGPYGWKFNGSGTAAAVVTLTPEDPQDITVNGFTHTGMVRSGEWIVRTMAFITTDGLPDISITSSEPVEGWIDQFYAHPGIYYAWPAFKRVGISTGLDATFFATSANSDFNTFGLVTPVYDYDAPVYCWYEDDTLVLVRHEFASVDASSDLVDGDCATSPRSFDVRQSHGGDSDTCPCATALCGEGVTCDNSNNAWIRVVRDGFYTSYYSDVSLSNRYPFWDEDYESDGQTGLGDEARNHNSKYRVFLDDDVQTADNNPSEGCYGTYDAVTNCFPPTITGSACSDTGTTTVCIPDPNVDGDTVCASGYAEHVEEYRKRIRTKQTGTFDGENVQRHIMNVPQFDASSAYFRVNTESVKTGNNSAVDATFEEPYRTVRTATGDGYFDFGGTCPPGHTAYLLTSVSCSSDVIVNWCANDSPPYGGFVGYDVDTSSSASYSGYESRLDSWFVARGTSVQLDDLVAATSTSSGSPDHPSCNVHWSPAAYVPTSPLRIYYTNSVQYYQFIDDTPYSGINAKVWQSDGGDFARYTSVRRTGELEPITQVSGYAAKTDELFSFIGWA
jgi:hypothetical protein